MLKAFPTIDGILVNDESIAMFRMNKISPLYAEIEIITNFSHSVPYVYSKGTIEDEKELMDKLESILSYEKWIRINDEYRSLVCTEHVKTLQKEYKDGVFILKIVFSDNNELVLFEGTEQGLNSIYDDIQQSLFSVIYKQENL